MRVTEAVEDLLAFSAGRDRALSSKHAQLLRERGLANAGERFEGADVFLALTDLTQQHQPVFVGQQAQGGAGDAG